MSSCREFEINLFCKRQSAKKALEKLENELKVYGGQVQDRTNTLSVCSTKKEYYISLPAQSFTQKEIAHINNWVMENDLVPVEIIC
jgi:predicted flavoprotein YhiN